VTAPAAARLAGFSGALRRAGLAVDAAAAIDFLAAVDRHPPADAIGLRRLGRLVFLRRIEDRPAYEAAFDAWFLGRAAAARREETEESSDDARAEPGDAPPELVEGGAGGEEASVDERLDRRRFAEPGAGERRLLATLKATAAEAMPRLRSRRRRPARRGDRIDVRRTAAIARRSFGVPVRLAYDARPERPRRLMLLIDVSGSLKTHTETFLKAAHALCHAGFPAEVFTFGTRLTRVTSALRHRKAAVSLERLTAAVADIDGGTRIGPALAALIAEPRHQGLIRSAVTVVVSDGLERGDPQAMTTAVTRLARMSRRLVWLSPLAARPDYVPSTRAMRAAAPAIDLLDDASSLAAFIRAFAALAPLGRAPRGRALRARDLGARP